MEEKSEKIFNKISQYVVNNIDEIEKLLRGNLIQDGTIKPEVKVEANVETPEVTVVDTNDASGGSSFLQSDRIDEYRSCFKILDSLPSVFQKPKKSRDLTRSASLTAINTTISQSATTLCESTLDSPEAEDIFNEFLEVKSQYSDICKNSASRRNETVQFLENISKLRQFVTEVRKQLPSDVSTAPDAFTLEEQTLIKSINEDMSKIISMGQEDDFPLIEDKDDDDEFAIVDDLFNRSSAVIKRIEL